MLKTSLWWVVEFSISLSSAWTRNSFYQVQWDQTEVFEYCTQTKAPIFLKQKAWVSVSIIRA